MSEMAGSANPQTAMLTQAVSQSRIALCLTDPSLTDNPIVYANAAFLELFGYDASDVLGRNCRMMQGPDTDRHAVARVRKALDERRIAVVDLLNYRKDGSAFINALQIGPIFDSSGRLTHFFGSQLDVSADRAAEARAKQVAENELRHRLTNIMSVLEVLVRLTAREQLDAATQAQRIAERIRAVGQVHLRALVEGETQADLHLLAERVLQAYASRGARNYQLVGPAVTLRINNVSPLVLLLHELAANAVKHGALSRAAGKVTLTWSIEPDAEAHDDDVSGNRGRNGDDRVLALSWREEGGPEIVAPQNASGARIVADLVAFAHGRLDYEWHRMGLVVQARLPL